MRVLLCYSRNHFEPDGASEVDPRHVGSSAHVLASTLHAVLSQLGEVTYIDPGEHASVSGRAFDLFVGQVGGFTDVLEACVVARSVLFVVNMHPQTRNETLRAAMRRDALPSDALGRGEIVDVGAQVAAIEAADYIVGVGNVAVLNSYVENGVAPSKIKMVNYGVGPRAEPAAEAPAAHRFVYTASHIGLRKGFDVVEQLSRDLVGSGSRFHLDIVGTPASPHYRRRIEALVAEFPAQVAYHGWVDVGSPHYATILREAAYLIAPALEEGQAGAVLDALRQGVVPLVSHCTGVDFSPLGVLEPRTGSAANRAVLDTALGQTPEQLSRLRDATLAYYAEFHEHFQPALQDAIEGCVQGSPHPLVSVVLPIFNKEKSIGRLLESFDRAAVAYGNIELHVIFDGCDDRTEDVVREFYATRTAYVVTYEVTPNIFEVKTSNIGLRKSHGRYCVLLQDDNLVHDSNLFFEVTTFLDKTATAAVLGCLAGVNFYPLGTRLHGPGQISMTEHETYWRQDADTDPALVSKFFQVDACMRGPLVVRRDFLLKHGYLDEVYAPLYMDDMDLGMRVADRGSKVYAMLGNVENESLTMAHYGVAKRAFFEKVIAKNTKIFYDRWSPSPVKDYSRLERVPISGGGSPKAASRARAVSLLPRLRSAISALRYALRVVDTPYCQELAQSPRAKALGLLRQNAAQVPAGSTVVDVGAGPADHPEWFTHTQYTRTRMTEALPLPDDHADVVVCRALFERYADPVAGVREVVRVLKPGGRVIVVRTAAAGGDDAVLPRLHSGYTRAWYERILPEQGLEVTYLEPDGGLYAHTAELLWRGRDQAVGTLRGGRAIKRLAARFLQVVLYNVPTLFLHKAEEHWLVEDASVSYFVVAQKHRGEESR
jgi:glycosyltransferase involved in cell wall biosynthesis